MNRIPGSAFNSRTACSNSLKNLGLGALNYHDVHKHFPLNYGAAWANESPKDQPAVGWILDMLPQIEEQGLYDRFTQGGAYEGNFRADRAHLTVANAGIISTRNGISCPQLLQTQLAILSCPSDPDTEKLKDNQFQFSCPSSNRCPVAVTNYKGVLDDTFLGQPPFFPGSVSNDASAYPSGIYHEPPPSFAGDRDCHNNLRCRGVFFRQSYQRPVKISSVTDGTSKTLMIGEDLPEYNRHSTAFYSNGTWCSCNLPLNSFVTVDSSTLNLEFWWEQQGFRSRHPGGAQFCLVDGSVRFISETVSSEAYRTACTRNGDETTSESL